MRVRILRKVPSDYDVACESLRVGGIYNLDPSLASLLVIDGYGELYDLLTPDEKRAVIVPSPEELFDRRDR